MGTSETSPSLSFQQSCVKRAFDFFVAFFGLIASGWLILLAFLLASLDTRSNGFFVQERVGQNGRIFRVFKIKTMVAREGVSTTVTKSGDPRITTLGHFFRKTKIDELPQLWNVFVGDMSFVGPRPDVAGFADQLEGADKALLSIRPGITGPATLKYRNEEAFLAEVADPETYNFQVLWPDKVRINLEYIHNWSFRSDLGYIWKTVVG
jgi:lipopolysaccharide/colanic/teichoic acid biosynthesis glycosyltransferase